MLCAAVFPESFTVLAVRLVNRSTVAREDPATILVTVARQVPEKVTLVPPLVGPVEGVIAETLGVHGGTDVGHPTV